MGEIYKKARPPNLCRHHPDSRFPSPGQCKVIKDTDNSKLQQLQSLMGVWQLGTGNLYGRKTRNFHGRKSPGLSAALPPLHARGREYTFFLVRRYTKRCGREYRDKSKWQSHRLRTIPASSFAGQRPNIKRAALYELCAATTPIPVSRLPDNAKSSKKTGLSKFQRIEFKY